MLVVKCLGELPLDRGEQPPRRGGRRMGRLLRGGKTSCHVWAEWNIYACTVLSSVP